MVPFPVLWMELIGMEFLRKGKQPQVHSCIPSRRYELELGCHFFLNN
jgi:hypothetical protein